MMTVWYHDVLPKARLIRIRYAFSYTRYDLVVYEKACPIEI